MNWYAKLKDINQKMCWTRKGCTHYTEIFISRNSLTWFNQDQKKRKKQLGVDKELNISEVARAPIFCQAFREDLGWWYKNDKQKAYKILDLVSEIMKDKDPFSGIGKPETLKFLDSDTWSRRIDLEHRLIYRVKAEQIDFLQARYHYGKWFLGLKGSHFTYIEKH